MASQPAGGVKHSHFVLGEIAHIYDLGGIFRDTKRKTSPKGAKKNEPAKA
jgi:hypothetical protein